MSRHARIFCCFRFDTMVSDGDSETMMVRGSGTVKIPSF
jgi:hypothetical protein